MQRFESNWWLVACVVALAGCGGAVECPTGYVEEGGVCIPRGAEDAGRAAVDAGGSPTGELDGAVDGGGDAAMSAERDAASEPDAWLEPDAAPCPYATLYADTDGDGFGDAMAPLEACEESRAGYVADATDCDDTRASTNPGATEVCNGVDDDCDGAIDEGVLLSFFRDNDEDGYGRDDASVQGCTAPAGFVARGGDCNDASAAIHPGATEVCNGVDDDCDTETDEGLPTRVYYADCDGDGFTTASSEARTDCALPRVAPTSCGEGVWRTARSARADCNDRNANAFPGQTEYFAERLSTGLLGPHFDYDCNGSDDRMNDRDAPSCGISACSGSGSGWVGSVPACGVLGTLRSCRINSSTGLCGPSNVTQVQRCR